ncbi:heterokaryon incompatibility protein-domain-containing protein [Fomes fomentarius]|nr:heterokaryon incompatibility protein-domain-containing protein [Fomes fomentarius]
MWLLSTDRAELHSFTDHTAVKEGYAILSHTWGHEEQTFRSMRELQEQCERTGENPRDCASPKIQNACILAEEDGYLWIWIDSCCIDKTSSSELSEAINSMFTWYSSSEVCYAYLEDVPSFRNSAFRNARWHTRGWTLQELIAPTLVVFVSNDWKRIGTKDRLSTLLEDITGIKREILTLEEPWSSQSVATRMFWASRRQTSRVEDRAYSLMGLFNVNMPTIYGEGHQAFRRLQLEIMKQTFDTSLFAWNNVAALEVTDAHTPMTYDEINNTSTGVMSLLAPTPGSFSVDARYTPTVSNPLQPYLPWQGTGIGLHGPGPFGELKLPCFSQSSYGIECSFPVFEAGGVTVAILLCDNSHSHLGLLLHPTPDPVQDPTRKMYCVGYGFKSEKGSIFARIIAVGPDYYNIRFQGQPVVVEWRNICIQIHDPAVKASNNSTRINGRLKGLVTGIDTEPPFRMPRWLLSRLSALYLWPYCAQLQPQSVPTESPLCTATAVTISCCNAQKKEAMYFHLGTCTSCPAGGGWRRGMPRQWASVEIVYGNNWDQPQNHLHRCADDHIEDWPDMTKEYAKDDRIVRLSFTHCKVSPKTTLVMCLELDGPAYKRRSVLRRVSLPSFRRPTDVTDTGSLVVHSGQVADPLHLQGLPSAPRGRQQLIARPQPRDELSVDDRPTRPPHPPHTSGSRPDLDSSHPPGTLHLPSPFGL